MKFWTVLCLSSPSLTSENKIHHVDREIRFCSLWKRQSSFMDVITFFFVFLCDSIFQDFFEGKKKAFTASKQFWTAYSSMSFIKFCNGDAVLSLTNWNDTKLLLFLYINKKGKIKHMQFCLERHTRTLNCPPENLRLFQHKKNCSLFINATEIVLHFNLLQESIHRLFHKMLPTLHFLFSGNFFLH